MAASVGLAVSERFISAKGIPYYYDINLKILPNVY
jgi:hypothetical protein